MATAQMNILATVSGASEGGNDLINISITNTAAVYTITETTLATNGITGAVTFAIPTGARQVLIVPPTTNTFPYRLGGSTADSTGHIALTSNLPTLLGVTTGISTVVLWTSATTAVPGVRVVVL